MDFDLLRPDMFVMVIKSRRNQSFRSLYSVFLLDGVSNILNGSQARLVYSRHLIITVPRPQKKLLQK